MRQKKYLEESKEKFDRDGDAIQTAIENIPKQAKKMAEKMAKAIGDHKLADDEKGRIVSKFEKEIFIKLVEADRTDVLEEI